MTRKIFQEKLGMPVPAVAPFFTKYDRDRSNGLDMDEFKEFFKDYIGAVMHISGS